jgi:hypothetical protein
MLKFFRATSLVAVSCILVSAVFTADASFAFGNDQGLYLKANSIAVDATQIAAERAQLDLAKSGKVTATLADNGDIIFVPKFGINGAACVSSFAYLFYFGFVLRVFMKEFGLSLKDFFFFRKQDWIQFVKTIKQ